MAVSVPLRARVDRPAEHHQPVIEILRGEIEQHVEHRDEIVVPAECIGQPTAEQRRRGRKHRIIQQHERHRLGTLFALLKVNLRLSVKFHTTDSTSAMR